eukprot:TRINITY_DN236_c0_g1_i1.p1 TRINITY_DN236_c0_g1~~TRINITY_DN236_c0_g1_i1.p1  ORF type:complete len:286 (+),score=75.15 TRINITY_DN236_c0_g1_i1:181-1038(+)
MTDLENQTQTAKEHMLLTIEGDRTLPAFVTIPDVGLDSENCFRPFLSENVELLQKFCLYHIHFPGQTPNSPNLLAGQFPTFTEILAQIKFLLDSNNVTNFIGCGVGAGGTILLHFGFTYPRIMKGLVMVSATPMPPGWTESLVAKVDQLALENVGMNEIVIRQFLSRWFSSQTMSQKPELVQQYRDFLTKLNPHNLGEFIQSFASRKPPIAEETLSKATFEVFVVIGEESGHIDDITDSFHLFDVHQRAKLEVEGCSGLVTVEQPKVFSEPLNLFFQGLGEPYSK